ncbi:choline dehydrogenase [Mesorhizobium sp. M6A.T.Ce.TU.016.01.1.1]|uniref:choline dehydrogenase n=1 Tax=Mesorhizobium sp. M6A.T.Ce.TU.016.01.1.1 TaxID=2496783 RepID=UPI000FCA17F4|nr:choline dehydrogenase [Mesorhizobium sp. M6A.T.Ce.TU.016.01.1.1]RUU30820.1 choline dehydrogenase [Mesorhizobium sp. M6A.T.Ce.TU.016.01.1.1]
MASKAYDYIVVGAGAAGSIVAARLGEDKSVRVLVLEAGPSDNSIYVRMPAAMSYPLTDQRRTWSFETGPEAALGERMITHVRGKMLGGSGSLNGMVYVRGNPRDFDGWAQDGLPDWSYAHCLPYFKRLETYDKGANAYRGGDGPIAITTLKGDLPVFKAFLEAGQQAGHPLNPDYNAYRQEGVHIYQANIDRGVRASGGRAYLRPAMRRGNVELKLNALVHRVNFDGKRAVGVTYEADGATHTVEAGREVVLCGGAFNSPQLLLLSGVGRSDELGNLGIKSVANVPGVGKGLVDHVAVSVRYRASRRGVSPAMDLNMFKMGLIGAQWLFLRSGLGVTNLWEVGTFFRSSAAADYANIQHEFLPMLGELMHGTVNIEEGFQYQTCLMRPKSRGAVTLKSADPRMHPSIISNYLAHPQDQRDLIDGVRHTDEIIQQRAWDGMRGQALTPGLRTMPDAEVLAWLKENLGTQYHPCSTCRMGVDDMSVVDADGKVHETEGLRVIDASVMPRITSGNLHCPTMMIAEKLVERVRGRAPLPPETVDYADQR